MGRSDIERFRSMLTTMLAETAARGGTESAKLFETRDALADPADRATQETDLDLTLIMRERDRRRIDDIRAALVRLDSGDYGVCEECGEDIPAARLKARPMTTLCVECQARAEQSPGGRPALDDGESRVAA